MLEVGTRSFLPHRGDQTNFGCARLTEALRCPVGWVLCSCLLPGAPAACFWHRASSGELVEGANPLLESHSASLARSFSADLARCMASGAWRAEAAGAGECAGPRGRGRAGSWVTLLLVAAHGDIGSGTSILWAPSLFVAVMCFPFGCWASGRAGKRCQRASPRNGALRGPVGQKAATSHAGDARRAVSSCRHLGWSNCDHPTPLLFYLEAQGASFNIGFFLWPCWRSRAVLEQLPETK